MKSVKNEESGFLLPALIVTILAFAILAAAAATLVLNNFFIVGNNITSQKAFNIAEGGVNYYLWHLSHSAADYQDGHTGGTVGSLGYGPYVHNYVDASANTEGTYTLYIMPPSGGSSVVSVRAIGKVTGSNISRTVVAQIGATSFANYAVLSDTALWFGNDENADGPVQSNQGVRMDGANSDQVASATTSYTPSNQLGGDGNSHPGVWCNLSVTTPVNCSTRSKAAWQYPVTSIDFNQVTSSLCTMKKTALNNFAANACSQLPTTRTASYLPERSATYNVSRGYLIQLNTNNTYDLYYVNGETDTSTPYTSALSLQSVATGIAIPSSGVIYAEDNVWVRTNPTFTGRVSIGAGRLADNNSANITIADDLVYGAKDGTDVIGLVAEGDVDVAPYAPPASGNFNFEIDAAVLSQTGSVQYPYTYNVNQNRCTRGWTSANQTFNFYGSVASRQTWTWTWETGSQCGDASFDATNGYISGIEHNTTSYDYNLLYNPPPSFPVTGGFNILSWREVLTHP